MKVLLIYDKYSKVDPINPILSNPNSNLTGSFMAAFENDSEHSCETLHICDEPDGIKSAEELNDALLSKEFDIAVVSSIKDITVYLETAKKLGKKLFLCAWDTPCGITSNLYTNFRIFIKSAIDIGYIKYRHSILEYSEYCNILVYDYGYGEMFPNIYCVSTPQDDRIYYPGVEEERIYDVSFVGTVYTSERSEFINALNKSGINVNIFGGKGGIGEELSFSEYAKKFRQSKISLNFNHSGVTKQRKGRIFETAASGSFLVTNFPETLKCYKGKWFTENSQFAGIEVNNCAEIIKNYLDNPASRIQAANSMYETYKKNYSAKAWWSNIFSLSNDK